MSQNYLNNNQYSNQPCVYPQASPNAVSINIYSPQAYGGNQPSTCLPPQANYYPMYGPNTNPNLPMYPPNYNNMISQDDKNLNRSNLNAADETNLHNKTDVEEVDKKDEKDKKKKPVTPLTDEYVKTLENYLDNNNPKIRLIGAKNLMDKFKEDDNRKDNPSLIPLLNKALKDTSPSVRFLALTSLQLGYCVGNEETVAILKDIQANGQDKLGEDSLLASDILLKMSAVQPSSTETGGNQ